MAALHISGCLPSWRVEGQRLLPPRFPSLHRKQGYQTFTQACGNLPLLEPRDAFLANLCEFALAVPWEPGSEADSLSPRGGPQDKLASPRSALVIAAEAAESGLVLAPKNVQSMRTLFNIAHRLSNVLGPAWGLVLETMNTLVRQGGRGGGCSWGLRESAGAWPG